jgi:hypothetical protein
MTTRVVGGLRFVKVGSVGLCFWWPRSATLDWEFFLMGTALGVPATILTLPLFV